MKSVRARMTRLSALSARRRDQIAIPQCVAWLSDTCGMSTADALGCDDCACVMAGQPQANMERMSGESGEAVDWLEDQKRGLYASV